MLEKKENLSEQTHIRVFKTDVNILARIKNKNPLRFHSVAEVVHYLLRDNKIE